MGEHTLRFGQTLRVVVHSSCRGASDQGIKCRPYIYDIHCGIHHFWISGNSGFCSQTDNQINAQTNRLYN